MDLFPVGSYLVLSSLLIAAPVCAQNAPSNPGQSNAPTQSEAAQVPAIEPTGPVAADAPRMTKQTRYEIIKDFETQIVYSRTAFPMGARGLNLRNGVVSPQGQELQQLLTIWGPSIKPGDPAHISYVRIKDDHIHFDLNGGPVHRKKWYQHIQVAGANGTPVPLSNDQSTDNPHGSYLDVYFDKYVPRDERRAVASPPTSCA